jgi:hypothetical protein
MHTFKRSALRVCARPVEMGMAPAKRAQDSLRAGQCSPTWILVEVQLSLAPGGLCPATTAGTRMRSVDSRRQPSCCVT